MRADLAATTSATWRAFVRNCQRIDVTMRWVFPLLYGAFVGIMMTDWILDTYSKESYAEGQLS